MKVVRSKVIYERMKNPKFLKLLYSQNIIKNLESKGNIEENTAPEIFVGSYGYPKVLVGPVLSINIDPIFSSYPNKWIGMNVNDIIKIRSNTLRGEFLSDVRNPNKNVQELQISALSSRPSLVFSDIIKINKLIKASEETAISGPSFKLSALKVKDKYTDYFFEKVYYDFDLNAKDAVLFLYSIGKSVYDIQKLLSIGALGVKSKRRLVPTRWSITAIDDIISKENIEKIKQNESIDKIRIFSLYSLSNKWIIIIFPGSWEYESIEIFYPGTTYNQSKDYAFIYSSYEDFNGRKDYAEMGGCYYAARLVVSEYLRKLNKQGKVLILREVYEDYKIPLGVWNVREHVNLALKQNYIELNNYNQVLEFIKNNTIVRIEEWIKNSYLLKKLLFNKSLLSYS
ncbi:MAG: hypothetical protein QXX36_01245 [Candidatus Rehaiarchaeum fermentans]|nr:hypothetical protein [Candidatus Rehaiarchaeum fermentans]MCW1302237.1 hypothetical protein [Candidatus Rehaiarchaeum fermentans]